MSSIYECCENIITNLNTIKKETERLTMDMQNIHEEETDINHYIELNILNKDDSYMICNELHTCLNKRRETKNQLLLGQAIEKSGIFKTLKALDEAMTFYKREKYYTPRVRTDLFTKITVPQTVEEDPIINEKKEVEVIELIEVNQPEKKVFKPVYAKKNKNTKRFMNLDDAVQFVAKRSGKCANTKEWEDLMRKKIINAIKNGTEFCGYHWSY